MWTRTLNLITSSVNYRSDCLIPLSYLKIFCWRGWNAAFRPLVCRFWLSTHPLKMERPIKKVTNYKKAEAHNRERGRVGGGRNEMK